MKKTTRNLIHSAVIAALYVLLSLLQNMLLPNTTSMMVQFRVAEALCILAFFTPAAIPGLTLGCLLYNRVYVEALPLDFLVGTAATLLAALAMYALRNVRLLKIPALAMLMPAVFNALLVGWELTYYFKEVPFWINALCVAAGEVAVLFVLGTPLYFALSNKSLKQRLFGVS